MRSMRYCCMEKGLILETVAKKKSLKGRTSGRTTGGYTATGAGEDLFPDLGRVCVLSSTTIAHCLRQANGYALETHRYLLYGTLRFMLGPKLIVFLMAGRETTAGAFLPLTHRNTGEGIRIWNTSRNRLRHQCRVAAAGMASRDQSINDRAWKLLKIRWCRVRTKIVSRKP